MKKYSSFLIFAGFLLVLFSATVLIATFYPVIKIEISYLINKPHKNAVVVSSAERSKSGKSGNEIVPLDEEFGLVIPKIGANSKIIANVDPYNEKIYQQALTHGVAHARGSAFPNAAVGNTFLFSHSSVNFWQAVRYNSIFYLIGKLEKDDDIYVFYKGKKYQYKVTEKHVVDANNVSYLNNSKSKKILTLMTCTPPGTTLNRLIVIARAIDQ